MKILTVEDNEIVNLLYEAQFKKLQVSYCLAKTAEEALALYRETDFDLILCDFYLPDMNGFDLCQQLRALGEQKGEKRIPILLVSGEKDEVKKDPKAIIFDDWFQKPLTEEMLTHIIAIYL